MLAGGAELGLAGHRLDLLAHPAEGGIDARPLGLGVFGDGMLDDYARLVEDRHPARHPGDQFQAGEAHRSAVAPHAAALRPVGQPGAGDQLRQDHRDCLQRLDLDLVVAARLAVLDGEHTDRAFAADDRHAGEAVEMFLPGFRAVGEGGVAGGLGEVEHPALVGDRPDQALAHREPGTWTAPCAGRGGEQFEPGCRAANKSSRLHSPSPRR